MRTKRDTLEKTIIDGQRLIFKGCYSRPLWSYNARLADQIEANGDYNFGAKDDDKFQKVIYDELLAKIEAIQRSLYSDIDVLTIAAQEQQRAANANAGFDDDMLSEMSGNTNRMATGVGGRSMAQSRAGSSVSGMGGGKLGRRMSNLMGLKAKLANGHKF